jgi:hypothetical protein
MPVVQSLVLIEGQNVVKENVLRVSLQQAKTEDRGSLGRDCLVFRVSADSLNLLQGAITELAQVKDVTGITIAAIRAV